VAEEDIMAIRFHRTGLIATGKGPEVAAFAAEVSAYVTETFGAPTVWGMQVGGTYGTVHWFTEYADMTEFGAVGARTLTDPGYLALMAKGAGLFVQGSLEDAIIWLV
jgi:hypothetical protein